MVNYSKSSIMISEYHTQYQTKYNKKAWVRGDVLVSARVFNACAGILYRLNDLRININYSYAYFAFPSVFQRCEFSVLAFLISK